MKTAETPVCQGAVTYARGQVQPACLLHLQESQSRPGPLTGAEERIT